jgi:hypothetical protein
VEEVGLGGGLGAVFGAELGDEVVEIGLAFAGEEGGEGVEAMFEGVLGGAEFSVGGAGAGGFLGVCAIGV